MSKKLPAGFFCWADVAVTDPKATHTFFSELLGWRRRVRPTDDAHAYSIMTLDGRRVAGICEVEETGPSQWMSYLLVDDLKASTARVGNLGGTVLKADIKIIDKGEMSVVQDPTGAIFALWQSAQSEPDEHRCIGSVGWTELLTPDVEKASAFYSGLVGWEYSDTLIGGTDYRIFTLAGREVGGMKKGTEPAAWRVHFAVNDCDAKCKNALELGGKVLDQAFDLEQIGRCALLADPSGGVFGIVEYEKL